MADIERTKSTTQLRVTEEHYRLLVESVRDYAIFMLDPKGHVATWNLGAERAKGYRASEIIGHHFSIFYPEEDIKAGKCDMELEVAAREGRFEDEGWRKRKDGSYFWANVVITALRDEHGQLVGFAKVTRDLTERKNAEDERVRLVAAQKAREAADMANRAKDDFLAHVSHELRTPLNAILGWARLLGTLDEAKRARAMKTIERNADAMRQLIDDLLDVSRIISGRMRLDIETVDLALLVERAIETVKVAADAKELRVSVNLEPGVFLKADASRLQQVVWNLLTNAVKFTPKGGSISVVGRRAGEAVELEVVDTGIGMSPNGLTRAFEPFWQGSGANRAMRGLGLGLAISKKLVELHGGEIEAASEGEGRGTSIRLRLPTTASPVVFDMQPVRAPQGGRMPKLDGLHVLVVDDEDDARELVRTVLGDCGAAVTTAGDVTEAMDAFERAPFDVVVSDIGLPGEDGYALIRKIRARAPEQGGRVAAVAMTAYARSDDRTKALAAGFLVHIPKPIEPAELAAVVAALAPPAS